MNKKHDNHIIDSHIRNTLEVYSEAEPSWTEEDEVFWEKMQPQLDLVFQKKKKRKFFIILFSSLLVLIITGILYFSLPSVSHEENLSARSNTPAIVAQQQQQQQQQQQLEAAKKGTEANVLQSKSNLNSDNKNQISSLGQNAQLTSKISTAHKSQNAIHKSKDSRTVETSGNQESKNDISSLTDQNQGNISSDMETGNVITATKSSGGFTENSILDQGEQIIKSEEHMIDDPTSPVIISSELATEVQTLEEKQSGLSFKEYPLISLESVQSKRDLWELGLGHTRFVSNPLVIIPPNQQSENKSISIVDSRFESYNFIAQRGLTKRLALSTGWHYIKQYAQLEYSLSSVPYEEDENNLKREFGAIAGRNLSALTEDFQEDRFFIKFLPGKEANEGDLLDIEGYADAYINIYQLPIQLNYFRSIGRWELVAFTGISFNAIYFSIPRFEMEIKYNDELISNDINFSPQNTSIFFPNIILGAGVRYSLTEKLNAQIFYNHNPLDSKFARIQYGLTYTISP